MRCPIGSVNTTTIGNPPLLSYNHQSNDTMKLKSVLLFLLPFLVPATSSKEDVIATLTERVAIRAPLELYKNDLYVFDLLEKYGYSNQSVDNIMAAINHKYGDAPPFKSGWMTAHQRHALMAQFTAFYTTLKVDQPSETAKATLESMDRTAFRNKVFNDIDVNPNDRRLSVEETQVYFRRNPTMLHQVFAVQSSQDALHGIQKQEKAQFALLRYDQDGDHVVSLPEFLIDDAQLKKTIMQEINRFDGKGAIAEWIEENQSVAKICLSPKDCFMEGDTRDKERMKQKRSLGLTKSKNEYQKRRSLVDQVKDFYGLVEPGKAASAQKIATRWSDEPRRLHAAFMKRYFKESIHLWWGFLSLGALKLENDI